MSELCRTNLSGGLPQQYSNRIIYAGCCAAFQLGVRQFFAHFLFVLAAWTLTIKWILPVVWALNENVTISTYIWWDFWWVIHIALGVALIYGFRFLFSFLMIVSALEIVIVVTKFVLFLPDPEWTIWTMNWFVNKVFVLVIFVMLLLHALFNRHSYQH